MARSRLLIISGNKRIRTIAVVVVARKKINSSPEDLWLIGVNQDTFIALCI